MKAITANFNSIKVRLELFGDFRNFGSPIKFQFHKGTIRTDGGNKCSASSAVFQFHKGTIRTDARAPTASICSISIP